MLSGAVVVDRARRAAFLLTALEVVLGGRGFASRLRTASICAGSARCDAQAIASSRSPRSGRARASSRPDRLRARAKRQRRGIAGGRDDLAVRTATACTRWRASTVPPRRRIR